MTPALLTINAGSSNLKWAVYALDGVDGWSTKAQPSATSNVEDSLPRLLAKGHVDSLSSRGMGGRFIAKAADGLILLDSALPAEAENNPDNALKALLEWLAQQPWKINAVMHRVVHGGGEFSHAIWLNEARITALDQLSNLAPLHQPPPLLPFGLSDNSSHPSRKPPPLTPCFTPSNHPWSNILPLANNMPHKA